MQILKRARNAEMDIISTAESASNIKDEANRRAAKAGYCTRDGQPRGTGKSPRPINKKLYDQNYERCFGHK